jgi:mono/diheme cytochrome c family protein
MRRAAAIFLCGISMAAVTSAHDVITTAITYSREISRLIYSRCAHCHRSGGAAFSLTAYAEARPWAAAIKEEVLERRMPPWGAVKGFGAFKDDQGLTQEQIELIADWVEGGAPEGDPALLPKVPDYAAERAAGAAGIPVDGALRLKAAVTLAGIQPRKVQGGGSVLITATRPDGSIEPLLWLYNYNPKFAHPYWYQSPIRLEAATKIEVTPAGAAVVELLSRKR